MHIVIHTDENGRNAGFVFRSHKAAKAWAEALARATMAYCICAVDARNVRDLYRELAESDYVAYPLRKNERHKADWGATHRFFTAW